MSKKDFDRRDFLKTGSAAVAGVVAAGSLAKSLRADEQADKSQPSPETAVKQLYEALTDKQRTEICFD